jgi:hypothetical protein
VRPCKSVRPLTEDRFYGLKIVNTGGSSVFAREVAGEVRKLCQLDGGVGRRGHDVYGHEAGRVGVGRRGGVMEASFPGVEGGEGDALAVAESGDGQSAVWEALQALFPGAAGVRVRAAARP